MNELLWIHSFFRLFNEGFLLHSRSILFLKKNISRIDLFYKLARIGDLNFYDDIIHKCEIYKARYFCASDNIIFIVFIFIIFIALSL